MTSSSSQISSDARLRQLVREKSDAELATTTLTALAWDAGIPAEALDVVVSHGWVILGGSVEVPFQRQAVERIVHHLAGVRGVINRITVRVPTPTPREVRERVERALNRNAGTDAGRIHIEVSREKVVLQGTVLSQAERRAAEGAALTAPGITEVENYLVVTPLS